MLQYGASDPLHHIQDIATFQELLITHGLQTFSQQSRLRTAALAEAESHAMRFPDIQSQPLVRRKQGEQHGQCGLEGATIASGEDHHFIRIKKRVGRRFHRGSVRIRFEQETQWMSIDLVHDVAHV